MHMSCAYWHRGWKWNSAKKMCQWLKRGKSETEEDSKLPKKCKTTDNPTFIVNLTAEGSQRFKRRKKKKRNSKKLSDRTYKFVGEIQQENWSAL